MTDQIVKLDELHTKARKLDNEQRVEEGGKDRPIFDWDEISYGESELISILSSELRAADRDGNTDEMRRMFRAIRELAARYLIHVPKDWLISSAPDEIDWADPDSIAKYVRQSKARDLFDALGNPQDASGG
jgi:hypothetical protein